MDGAVPGEAATPDTHRWGRLLTRQIAAARAALVLPDAVEAIFATRRRLKKARTTVRLTRALDPAIAIRLGDHLRALSHRLAGPRDADARATAAANLARDLPDDLQDALGIAGRRIASSRATCFEADPNARSALAADLRRCEAEAARLPGTLGPDRLLRAVLVRTYRAGRRDFRAIVAGHADEEAFHDWRKRVKRRLHLAKWLPAGARAGRPVELARLKALAAALGQDRDLMLLGHAIATDPGLLPQVAADLADHIARHRRKLRSEALSLGARLYRHRACRFAQRCEPT